MAKLSILQFIKVVKFVKVSKMYSVIKLILEYSKTGKKQYSKNIMFSLKLCSYILNSTRKRDQFV